MNLEDLMQVEVGSVSKKNRSLAQTAAAIFVIGQEDIARSGATNIPGLLRMVPGMDVCRSIPTHGPRARAKLNKDAAFTRYTSDLDWSTAIPAISRPERSVR
jgi:hypothetical protein